MLVRGDKGKDGKKGKKGGGKGAGRYCHNDKRVPFRGVYVLDPEKVIWKTAIIWETYFVQVHCHERLYFEATYLGVTLPRSKSK